MTTRLYYDNSYLKVFHGQVIACRRNGDAFEIALDQSAFYPTSGGQPYDTGVFRFEDTEVPVLEVYADADNIVWHVTQQAITEGTVLEGYIDWARRFDNMQQHGGEHMLAGAVYRLLGGSTIGLHLGAESSTIDVTLSDGRTRLSKTEVMQIEEQVNAWIQQDDIVKCWFPNEQELAALPLRKPPTVKEHIRIVAFGNYEMVACGGTHPSSAGQIGLMKILSVTPAKGKARISFVCGMRALRYFSLCQQAAEESGRLLSCPVQALSAGVAGMKERLQETERQLTHALAETYLERMRGCDTDGTVCLWVPEGNTEAMRSAAAAYIRQSGKQVLCGGQTQLVFARSEDAAGDMSLLMRTVARGGGKPDFATGAGDQEALMKAKAILLGE